MPNLTIYVRDDDLPFFEQAKKQDPNMALSQVITQALKEYLQLKEEEGFHTITQEIGKELTLTKGFVYGTYQKIRFTGRLVARHINSNKEKMFYDSAFDWYLYVTPKEGWVAIRECWYKNDDYIESQVNFMLFDREYWIAKSFDELKSLKDPDSEQRNLLPKKLLDLAENKDDFVQVLDI
jgi:hypothetical protein